MSIKIYIFSALVKSLNKPDSLIYDKQKMTLSTHFYLT